MLANRILSLSFLIMSFAATVLADEAVESPPSAAEVPTWTLRYKFVPDQKLRYRNIENVTLDAMQGENRKVDVTGLEQRRIFTVSSVEESGAARLTMQYEFVRMQSQTNDFEPVLFDTTMQPDDIPPEFRTVARRLKGSAPHFWISSLGSALRESDSPDGYQPVEKGVARAGNVTVEDKKPESDTVQQAVATKPTATKETSQCSDAVTFLMPLPENPVAVDDTWRETLPVNVRVTAEISRQINILRTFRLESVENGMAVISFRSSVEAAVKTPTMRAQLIKATPKGTLTFDIDRGVMVKRELRYDETVLNAIGPNSVVLCNGTSTEELLENTPTAATAE
jgi:hypothetical protein